MIALVGRRMHQYVLDEIELGKRAAMCLDSENNCGWSAIDNWQYGQWAASQPDEPWDWQAGLFDTNTTGDSDG